jgi:hypothetical protein
VCCKQRGTCHGGEGRREFHRFICPDIAFTTPTTHHSTQTLTLTTKQRNEIPLPSAAGAGSGGRGDQRPRQPEIWRIWEFWFVAALSLEVDAKIDQGSCYNVQRRRLAFCLWLITVGPFDRFPSIDLRGRFACECASRTNQSFVYYFLVKTKTKSFVQRPHVAVAILFNGVGRYEMMTMRPVGAKQKGRCREELKWRSARWTLKATPGYTHPANAPFRPDLRRRLSPLTTTEFGIHREGIMDE